MRVRASWYVLRTCMIRRLSGDDCSTPAFPGICSLGIKHQYPPPLSLSTRPFTKLLLSHQNMAELCFFFRIFLVMYFISYFHVIPIHAFLKMCSPLFIPHFFFYEYQFQANTPRFLLDITVSALKIIRIEKINKSFLKLAQDLVLFLTPFASRVFGQSTEKPNLCDRFFFPFILLFFRLMDGTLRMLFWLFFPFSFFLSLALLWVVCLLRIFLVLFSYLYLLFCLFYSFSIYISIYPSV